MAQRKITEPSPIVVRQFTIPEIDGGIKKIKRRIEEVRALDPRVVSFEEQDIGDGSNFPLGTYSRRISITFSITWVSFFCLRLPTRYKTSRISQQTEEFSLFALDPMRKFLFYAKKTLGTNLSQFS